jgi:ribonucleoside-diphosphate reductase alpha chain
MLQIEKRSGALVAFDPKKILNRIKKAAKGLKVNDTEIFVKVITSIPTEGTISTKELDNLVAIIASNYVTTHPDYSKLAASVAISSYHKSTSASFLETMQSLNKQGKVNSQLLAIIESYGADKIQAAIDDARDYKFNYFAWRALEETYLLKDKKRVPIERPQHMYMRVALWVTNNLQEALEYYELLSTQLVSPATPIMINSGTAIPQLASCVLHYNDGDSRQALLNTFNDICNFSADAAGIGLCMSNIRSKETKIASSGGNAGGLLKYVKIVNEGLRFFNQQGKRPGACAIYCEPWHKDIFDLLDIKKNTGAEELRARDVFTALWVPDLFMKQLEADSDWWLFCPHDIEKAGLKAFDKIYGEEFETEYWKAVELGIGKKIKASDIFKKIVESQIETGVPYVAYKDNVNRKTNHKNIGVVKQSNLCIEIVQYTDEVTTAICTLHSLILKNFIKGGKFDFELLHACTRKVVQALNKVIDINKYSTAQGIKGGLEQRAIAIGVQGFADAVYMLDYIFTSEEAKQLNKNVWETIYHAAITESCELVKTGKYEPYKFFKGSPMSEGIFQFDMWGVTEDKLSGMWNWSGLKEDVKKYGICNSLFTGAMPTASSAKITDSYESFEPMDGNIFNRRVLGGEFTIVNQYLINDLERIGVWSEELKNEIIIGNGSIQNINFQKYLYEDDKNYEKKVKRIEHLIQKYKTVWEISQKELINMSAERGVFIDQSQSLNIYFAQPTLAKIFSSLMHSWKSGLKTGVYYTRTKAISTGAKQLGIDVSKLQPKTTETEEEKEMRELNELIDFESKKAVTKPENSMFDCFGCSS